MRPPGDRRDSSLERERRLYLGSGPFAAAQQAVATDGVPEGAGAPGRGWRRRAFRRGPAAVRPGPVRSGRSVAGMMGLQSGRDGRVDGQPPLPGCEERGRGGRAPEGTSKNFEVPAARWRPACDRARKRLISADGPGPGPGPDLSTRKTAGTRFFFRSLRVIASRWPDQGLQLCGSSLAGVVVVSPVSLRASASASTAPSPHCQTRLPFSA